MNTTKPDAVKRAVERLTDHAFHERMTEPIRPADLRLVLARLEELERDKERLIKERDEWEGCAKRTDAKMLHEQRDHNKTVDRLISAERRVATLREAAKNYRNHCETRGLGANLTHACYEYRILSSRLSDALVALSATPTTQGD